MTLHKLMPESAAESARALAAGISIDHREYSLARAILKGRALQSFDSMVGNFPIHRLVRCVVRGSMEDVFDDLALSMGLIPQRLYTGSLLLAGPGVIAYVNGSAKAGYCSCTAEIWADSKSRADEARGTMMRIIGDRRMRDETFVIDWHFIAGGGGLSNASFEEIAHEELHDEAYPVLGEPVRDFVNRYLAANETVLVILGPPGAGKTRLVRAILGELSRRKGEGAQVMYTCDKRALENDEIFVNFITGDHDAFVIEDADHILTPRASGNQDLHRFLAIADGVIRAQGRKIIFTTNLPNVGALDDALLRPGRCFAAIHTRSLTPPEAMSLIARICGGDTEREQLAISTALPPGTKSCSVASVYRACAK
jgi:energy-coupling factor transporter ATP-binding protein EcfA2